ncbi:hypothetical protein DCE79_00795 [Lysinibacillus sp. 2017]|uniref:S-layer homology domain-containing protein n=1 Tax=unclassified Lysinibacillus TaxID=2636778 RepID=UPI000D527C3A|nr:MULTISPECIES: S-layer homology domain-containing protein [unclassified Lysinibacillus]AWE06034.1 hypothetical protein DCE79_00795 [Lysinibacillus sp. 2017]TGN34817.1 S-layer homology domain-containing protein [Lysinibacillus sp. S2017]
MDSKKTRTLSKATVATVVAASGILVAMPQPSSAATFKDLNPYADYYEPVIDLVNRNIATGFADGTFKPNQAITRADAAKMLALAIDVNIANPKNPGFKDVNVNNGNYRYIAALAEAGIINGFTDNTFKPNEPITRGQMAKIITLGFQFGMSSKLNNSFRDVSPTNFAAYYIQTLVDLNVTKGTTTVTFDPFKNVTRAQMATFVWRAEKADRGTPLYTVGDVSGNTIYINGVAHTVASHLRSVINASNKNILNGAYIEGTFANNTLTNITKLTLNASGTSSRLLALDGNYTSFAGELVINGSYIRLKNLNFTGRVEVAEAPRRSLAALQNVRFASVENFASFIDWDTPTESKNDDFLNPIDNETLKDKTNPSTSPTSKYKERMANVKKYVDFEGSDLRNLVVTADRAFVKADSEIDRLTVRGDVTNFEFYADAKAMYLDNDYNMTVFGVHDIQYVYKNSLKNVKFNTDSTYDYYYVTTKSGYSDLGEFAYINDAIIPKGTTVNTIFDDFETDEPNIGYIEDENGTPVSRDPVGDTVISDESAPKITQLDVKAGGTIADGTITVDEDGMYYYVIKKAKEKAPTISEIKTGGVPLSGNGPVLMDEKVPFQATGLETKTDYVLYAIAIDGSDNVSEKKSVAFSTIDNKPPTLTLDKGDKMYGGKRVQFKVTPSEEGTIYYYIRPDTSAAKPTIDDIISNPTGTKEAKDSGVIPITEYKHGKKPLLEDIQPSTKYQIFAVMVDKSNNKMRYVEEISITTEKVDTTHPYILDPQELVLADKDKGYFYINVSEELDKETAENSDNYLLSGTGIVNISGHKEMKPIDVQYSNKRIRLTIPSLTSLVNGDTIVATILKGVKDLAENEFENKDTVAVEFQPRNYAQYNHTDALSPTLTIKNVVTGVDKYEIEVETNKAGTYYYMILPDTYDSIITERNILNRDFVDEFSTDPKVITGKFQTETKNDYLSNGQNPAPLGTFKFNVSKPITNPFLKYKIYMVLKDRSGQLSKIMDELLINDSKPPLVSGVSVESIPENDTKVKVTVSVDEKANFFVLPVKKYNKKADGSYELNSEYFDASGNLKDITDVLGTTATAPDLFNKYKAIGATDVGASTGKGTFSFNSPMLTAHEEYGMYIGAVDSIGNFTILQRSSDSELSADEPKGPQMKAKFYTDGTKPYIKTTSENPYGLSTTDAIIYRTPDSKFEITFNEAILRQNDTNLTNYNKSDISLTNSLNLSSIMVIRNDAGTDVTSQYNFDSYSVGTETNNESTLVIKPTAPTNPDKSITVTLIDDLTNAYDYYGKHTFDISKIGKYVYPTNTTNIMSDAKLGTKTADPNNSKEIIITPQLSATDVKEVYYVVVNNGVTYSPTAIDILNMVRKGIQPATVTINLYGKKLIEKAADTSSEMTLLANGTSNVFRTGQKIYMITLDRYGNINWVMNENNTTQKYSTVTN